jgi:hypothetical protein
MVMPDTVKPASTARRSRKWYALLLVVLLVPVVAGWLFLRYGARSGLLMFLLRNDAVLMPSDSIVRNLEADTGSLVSGSLDVLAERKYAGAQTRGRELLRSRDEYVWFSAALYLGKLGDSAAVPYLIKGLRHPAWRAHAQVVVELQALTGQAIGNDFEAWRQWWVAQHPGESFNFEMRGPRK